ncbi:hypothetical protein [Sphingomonas hankookensis]|nr:hypothetical protein [Sphingomonas hankookensis]WCP72428.1 hypothetical protein PPZ50_02380 [Sphingomonas hankookensis]
MGIAIASAIRAAAHWQRCGPDGAHGFQHALRRRLHRPIALARLLRTLAEQPPTHALLLNGGRIPGLVGAAARWTRIDSVSTRSASRQ